MGAAIAWFTSHGHTVCIPLTDSQKFDLVVCMSGTLFKVQVKTTSDRTNLPGVYRVELRTTYPYDNRRQHFDSTLIDYLFAMTPTGDRFFIPAAAIKGKRSISLGAKAEQWKIP